MGKMKRWGCFIEGVGSRNQNDKGLTRSLTRLQKDKDQGLEGNDQMQKLAEETGK